MDYKKQAEMDQTIAALRDFIPLLTDAMPQFAKLYFNYYKSLTAAGFSAQDAIYLVGQHGTSLGIKDQK